MAQTEQVRHLFVYMSERLPKIQIGPHWTTAMQRGVSFNVQARTGVTMSLCVGAFSSDSASVLCDFEVEDDEDSEESVSATDSSTWEAVSVKSIFSSPR